MTSTSARCSHGVRVGLAGALDFADIPPTRFRRKPHWLDAHFTGDSSAVIPGNHVATPDGRHVFEYSPRRRDRSGRAGESRCGRGASGCQAGGLRAACGARRRGATGHHADAASRRRRRAGARPDRRIVHPRLRRDRQPRRRRAGAADRGRRRHHRRDRGDAGRHRTEEPESAEGDAAILHDNLTAGAGIAAGFAKWSPDTGETISQIGWAPSSVPQWVTSPRTCRGRCR